MKDYSIELVEERAYVHVRVRGVWSTVTAPLIMSDVIAYHNPQKHRGLVVDSSEIEIKTSIVDDFFFTREFVEIGYLEVKKFALVVPTMDGLEEHHRFFRNASSNLGINLRLMRNVQEAIVWIKEDGARPGGAVHLI